MKLKETRLRITCSCGKDNWVLDDSGSGSKNCTYCKGKIKYSVDVKEEKKPVKPRRLYG